jgi:polyhydroxyalkanoate synthesis regulator phasin
MDPTQITAIATLVGAVMVGLNKLVDFALQRRKITVDFEVQDRRAMAQDAAAFRTELREEVKRLYDRIADMEEDHEREMAVARGRVDRLTREVQGLESYCSLLTITLRSHGYEVPQRGAFVSEVPQQPAPGPEAPSA